VFVDGWEREGGGGRGDLEIDGGEARWVEGRERETGGGNGVRNVADAKWEHERNGWYCTVQPAIILYYSS